MSHRFYLRFFQLQILPEPVFPQLSSRIPVLSALTFSRDRSQGMISVGLFYLRPRNPASTLATVIVSPFTNTFRYVHIPYGLAKHVLDKLNHYGAYASAPSYVDGIYSSWRKAQWEIHQHRRTNNLGSPLTLGYVTDDVRFERCRRGSSTQAAP